MCAAFSVTRVLRYSTLQEGLLRNWYPNHSLYDCGVKVCHSLNSLDCKYICTPLRFKLNSFVMIDGDEYTHENIFPC